VRPGYGFRGFPPCAIFYRSQPSPSEQDRLSTQAALNDSTPTAKPFSPTIYIALEYGTVAVVEVLTALRADNKLHAVADRQSPLAQSIKAQIRAALYVDTSYWKAAVFGRFADFVVRASRGLATANF
jgi:hypothetical protein